MTPLCKALQKRLPQFSLEDIAAILPVVQQGLTLPLPEIEAGVKLALLRIAALSAVVPAGEQARLESLRIAKIAEACTPRPIVRQDYRARCARLAERAAATPAEVLAYHDRMARRWSDWGYWPPSNWYEREDRALRNLLESIRECELP